MFLDHTQWRSIVGRTPLEEWSARRRDLYLTTHDTHNRQISMPPVGFEPKISAGERPQAARLLRSWLIITEHWYCWLAEENRSNRRKTCLIITLSTSIATCTGMGSVPPSYERLANKLLSQMRISWAKMNSEFTDKDYVDIPFQLRFVRREFRWGNWRMKTSVSQLPPPKLSRRHSAEYNTGT